MYTKRIIPCLDVNNNRVVKGINFVNLKDAGDRGNSGLSHVVQHHDIGRVDCRA